MTPSEICQSNLIEARKRKDERRKKFPFAFQMFSELDQHDNSPHPPFKPMVICMEENGERWGR